jgi:hypothetical protein
LRNQWGATLNTDSRGISADGLTLASFTAAASLFPDVTLPANFFSRGRQLHLKCRGMWAATGTPTYTFSIKVGSVVVITSAAVTVSALTNQAIELEAMIRIASEGTTGTLLGMGDLALGGVTGPNYLPATGTAPAPSSAVDLTVAQTLAVQVACSASSASNTVKGFICRYEGWDFS